MTGTPRLRHGSLVTDLLSPRWDPRSSPYGLDLDDLAGLAVRRNPRRAQLVVSLVLGKHVPAHPALVRATGRLLAEQVAEDLGIAGVPAPPPSGTVPARFRDPLHHRGWLDPAPAPLPQEVVVLGFCETATALGHVVADAFAEARYVHTTRRGDPARTTYARFDEEHSHAVAHLLQPGEGFFAQDCPVVLVDDELTTGTTALNTIAALQRVRPRRRYVVATLLDLRDDAAVHAFEARAATLGTTVTVVSLLAGSLVFGADALQVAAGFVASSGARAVAPSPSGTARVEVLDPGWDPSTPTGGRHGVGPADRPRLEAQLQALTGRLLARLGGDPSVLVVGTEELMYVPVRLAHHLDRAVQGHPVLVQSTTRSPVVAVDTSSYAIRRTLTFPAQDDPTRESFLHNVAPLGATPAGAPPWTDIVVVTDAPAPLARPLADRLTPWASSTVHVVAIGGAAP